MKRTFGGLVLLALVCGCGHNQPGSYMSQANNPTGMPAGGAYNARNIPNAVGPRGEPVAVRVPPTAIDPDSGRGQAREMLAQTLPPEILRTVAEQVDGPQGSMLQLARGQAPDAGGGPAVPPVPSTGPAIAPPGAPGAQPGRPAAPGLLPGPMAGPGAMPPGYPMMPQAPAPRTSVRFTGPAGMKVSWFTPRPDGTPAPSPSTLDVPARYNFIQAAIYRLKLSNIPNRPGVELYPTLEVVPCNSRTSTFLAHSSVPLTFTDEDFDQVQAGNYLVKVIYLPDPKFQDLVTTGPDEVVSTRLEPGVDPIQEAQKRGSILLVVRLGNIDLEAPNTPAMGSPGGGYPPKMMPPQMPLPYNGMPGPGPQVPYNVKPSGEGVPGGMPPGMMPPGMMPPGGMPPGMMPPGGGMPMMPPGMGMGPGGMPPGMGMGPGGPVPAQPVGLQR